jgi:hypothetical protein
MQFGDLEVEHVKGPRSRSELCAALTAEIIAGVENGEEPRTDSARLPVPARVQLCALGGFTK